jgi:4-amino-4-deoxy-L-arabinose transferase-like glycosyltransferase
MECKFCGKKISDTSVYCSYCGGKVYPQQPQKIEMPAVLEAKVLVPAIKNIRAEAIRVPDGIWGLGDGLAVEKHGKLSMIGPFRLLLAAFVFAFLGQAQLFFHKGMATGLVFFALSAIFIFLAHRASNMKGVRSDIPLKIEIPLFLLVMAVGIYFRVSRISILPSGLFFDEAMNGFEALNIMNGRLIEGSSMPVFIGTDTSTNAAMFIYFMASFFKLFGTGPVQLRMVSVVIGILSTAAFYFMVRYMLGSGMAVLGGLLFAAMRWHVNFSRIGFHAVFGVFALILVLYFAARVYRERKLQDFILFGAVIALSQYTYLADRIVPVSLIIFAVFLFFKDRNFLKENMKNLAISAAVALVLFLPMLNYMVRHFDLFIGRSAQVSVLSKDTLANFYGGRYTIPQIFGINLKSTMLMFNYSGDMNPRHNIPGYPMLDYVTGALAFMGLIYLLLRINTPLGFLAVLSFGLYIQASVLTIESPQGLRAILCVPVVCLFAAVILKKFKDYGYEGKAGSKIVSTVMASALVLCAVAGNYNDYFNKQAKNADCWASFATHETVTAQYLIKKGPGWKGILEPRIFGRTFEFVMGESRKKDYEMYNEIFPIMPASGLNYVYFFLPENEAVVEKVLMKLYPKGTLVPIYNGADPHYKSVLAYEVSASEAEEVARQPLKNGLKAKYFIGTLWQGIPAVTRIDPIIFFNWHIAPVAGHFSAEWTGRIRTKKAGKYKFSIHSTNYAELVIDGVKIIENPHSKVFTDNKKEIELSQGYHKIRLRYLEDDGFPLMQFFWMKPGDSMMDVVPFEMLTPA